MLNEPQVEIDVTGVLVDAVKDVFVVHDITVGMAQPGGMVGQREPRQAIRLRGELMMAADEAYDIVLSRFRNLGYTPLFRRDEGTDVIMAMPGELPTSEARPLLAGGLFIATVLSALFAGIMGQERVLADGFQVGDLIHGWPFALSLLTILVAHELGHYFVARHFGTAVSLPYFIPMPLSPFGTFGAVINMKAPPANRRQLLAIAAAGPLAGFVLAIPILIIGLSLSNVGPMPAGVPYMLEGNSLLYAAVKFLMFGRLLPGGGLDVNLHPVAFAGWAGLLVTGLNLLPVGTLDGGHIIYALTGERAKRLTWPIIGLMLLMSFIWNGWLLWAALLFLFGRYHAVPLNDITQLGSTGRVIAIAIIILFILTFVPIPLNIIQ